MKTMIQLTAIKVDENTTGITKEIYVFPCHIAWFGPYKQGTKLFMSNSDRLNVKQTVDQVAKLCE